MSDSGPVPMLSLTRMNQGLRFERSESRQRGEAASVIATLSELRHALQA